jgi:hypothetical protein
MVEFDIGQISQPEWNLNNFALHKPSMVDDIPHESLSLAQPSIAGVFFEYGYQIEVKITFDSLIGRKMPTLIVPFRIHQGDPVDGGSTSNCSSMILGRSFSSNKK